MQNKIYLWDRRSNSYLRQIYFVTKLPVKENTKLLFDENLSPNSKQILYIIIVHSQLKKFSAPYPIMMMNDELQIERVPKSTFFDNQFGVHT